MTCSSGQQKKYCMRRDWSTWDTSLSPCTEQGSGNTDSDWATCVLCLKTEKPKTSYLNSHECQLCNKQDNANRGEYYEDGQCRSCDGCSVMNTTFLLNKFEWENMPAYTDLLQIWVARDIDSKSFQWQNQWKYQTVGVGCAPLTRRVMKWDAIAKKISMTGADHYKAEANDDQKREKQVATFHAMHYDKDENKETKCVYERCEYFCEFFQYQYSNGCGQHPDPWVTKKSSVKVELSRMSELQTLLASSGTTTGVLNDYVIVPQGVCELCEKCNPGSYNPECNKWEVGVEPEGQCNTSLSKCDLPGHFLVAREWTAWMCSRGGPAR
jgi:hypothetical protein